MTRATGGKISGLIVVAALLAASSACGGGGGKKRTQPGTPGAVKATSERTDEVTVTWNAVARATGYVLYWSDTPGVTQATATRVAGVTSPYVHIVPASGTGYYYAVAAVTAEGEQALSPEAPVLPLDPPGFSSVQAATGRVTLEWSSLPGADAYDIFWSDLPGVTEATGTRIAGVTSGYTHAGRPDGVPTYYALRARNAVGGGARSSLSAEASATPIAAPTGLAALAGDARITLTWSGVTGATSYNLYWSTTPGVTKATGNPLPGVTSPHDHAGLANGTTYYYVATAVGPTAESDVSLEVSAAPVGAPGPQPPTGLTATPGATDIELDWNLVAGATSYNIYWATAPGVKKTTGLPILGVLPRYTHRNLTGGTTYYYVVTSVDPTGESAESVEVSATPAGLPPGRPTAVRVRPGVQELIISWRDVSGATSYNIYWDTVSGVTPATGTPIVGVTNPYVHTGLVNGTTYYYVVTAVNGAGEGPPSFEESGVPQAGGVIDGSFGTGGVFSHDNAAGGNDEDGGLAVIVDAAGRIVVAGYSTAPGFQKDMALWRITDAGALDTSFAGQGYVVHAGAAGGSGDEWGLGVAEDASGRLFVAGYGPAASGDEDMILWAYDSTGTLDPTFGTGGIVTHHGAAGGSGNDQGRAVVVDSTGRVLVAGTSLGTGSDDLAIWRFDGSGALDATFGTGGIVTHHNAAGGSGADVGESLALDASGNIVVTGRSAGFGTARDMAVWRFDPSGALDTTFGGTGYVSHHDAAGGGNDDEGHDVFLPAGGGIFVTGTSYGPSFGRDMAVWSYDDSGGLDPTFGTGGVYTIDGPIVGSGTDGATGIAVDALGRVLVGGYSPNGSFNWDIVVLRLDPSGVLDPAFATGGIFVLDGAAGGLGTDWGEDLALDGSGRILVTGNSPGLSFGADMFVARLSP